MKQNIKEIKPDFNIGVLTQFVLVGLIKEMGEIKIRMLYFVLYVERLLGSGIGNILLHQI